MSNAKRKQIAEAFREAKQHLRRERGDEGQTFICCALDETGHPAANDAKRVVRSPWRDA
jgi:hypothetical protein